MGQGRVRMVLCNEIRKGFHNANFLQKQLANGCNSSTNQYHYHTKK
jgi:hypothetical protein